MNRVLSLLRQQLQLSPCTSPCAYVRACACACFTLPVCVRVCVRVCVCVDCVKFNFSFVDVVLAMCPSGVAVAVTSVQCVCVYVSELRVAALPDVHE